MAADTAAGVINNYILKKRTDAEIHPGGPPGMLLTSKHENSIAYDTNLRYIRAAQEPCTVLVIVDAVSRKYFTSETSWLWDIDFDQLNAPPGAADHPLRPVLQRSGGAVLLHGHSPGKGHGPGGHPAAAAELKADGSENVYVVTCFSGPGQDSLPGGKGGVRTWN